MGERERILEEVRASLHREPRLKPDTEIHLDIAGGSLTIAGEVADVAVKKRLLARAAMHPAVAGIIDRLRVAAASPMGDKEIRDHVRDALLSEPALAEVAILERIAGALVPARRDPAAKRGIITISVADGVVTLDGDVPGLAQKRLAGVLAWWVPGSRDIVNGLGVTPPEEDSDEEIEDAVRFALEKDPFVNASQIRIGVSNAAVRLTGTVPTESERDMAEFDAWYVFGVDEVENRVQVRA
jgi:osmotically-inducible protein OsmY